MSGAKGQPCPVKGCTAHAKPNQLMCWRHWRRVPKPLNHAVFETYVQASFRSVGADAAPGHWAPYRAARDAAIAAVEAKEADEQA
jgi:hypothetical protein